MGGGGGNEEGHRIPPLWCDGRKDHHKVHCYGSYAFHVLLRMGRAVSLHHRPDAAQLLLPHLTGTLSQRSSRCQLLSTQTAGKRLWLHTLTGHMCSIFDQQLSLSVSVVSLLKPACWAPSRLPGRDTCTSTGSVRSQRATTLGSIDSSPTSLIPRGPV